MARGGVYKRGATWWIRYNVDGRQYRESAETSRKENAEALLGERLQAIWEGRFIPGKRKRRSITLGELRDLYLKKRKAKRSIDDDRRKLAKLVEHFGEHRQLATLAADELGDWFAEKEGLATRNRHKALVRGLLNFATREGYAHADPMAAHKLEPEDNGRDRVCSPEEYRKLVESAEGDLGACIVVGYWTGMRLGEIVNLQWDRLDLRAGLLKLAASATKEADAKMVPLPDEAVTALDALPRRLDGRVFRYLRNWYSREFGALVDRLKLPDLHFHDLRHTALTNMADAGVDTITMAAISGHKTLAMLQRYVHRRPAALKAAMARVEDHAAGRERS